MVKEIFHIGLDFIRKVIFKIRFLRIGCRVLVGFCHKVKILKPKVSIIIAAYNIEAYIAECLQSFADQYFINLEIIVIDDGSTDLTAKIIHQYKKKDPRVRFFKQANQGLSQVRNNGLKYAIGDFICFVDGDDKMERSAISDAVNSLQKTHSDFSVSYYVREIGGKVEQSPKKVILPGYWIQDIHNKYRPKTSIIKFPKLMQNTTAWGKVFRKDFILKNNLSFMPNMLYEDQPYLAKAYALATNGVDILDKVHYFWRSVSTSISNQRATNRDIEARIKAIKISLDIYKQYTNKQVYQNRLVQYLSHDFLASLGELPLVKNKTEWLNILREAVIYLMNNLDKENLNKISPLSRMIYQLIINQKYGELFDFYDETFFKDDALYIKNKSGVAYLDIAKTFLQAKNALTFGDFPVSDDMVHLINNLYAINPAESDNKYFCILGWAFLTCLDPKLFSYNYSFIVDTKPITYELFNYTEILRHDISQTINYLSTGFKIKIPRNAKRLIIKLSAAGFSRTFYVDLRYPIKYLLAKLAGKIQSPILKGDWQKSALSINELGSYNRARFIRQHKTKAYGSVVPKTVLFRTYYGEKCVDSALSLHQDLYNRAKGVWKLYWGVEDLQVKVPPGGIPVIVGSEKWFRILSTCEVLVENVHQVEYFYKQTDQKILQTFHGYPFKQMGHKDWQLKQMPAYRFYSFDRRAAQWDWVLAPAPYAEPLYREAFKYKGNFIDTGYPRNDIFFDKLKCQAINKQVRAKLNIPLDKKVILYAPTYRDYLSKDEFEADMVKNIFNYKNFMNRLGQDFVLLIRGHMMNARSKISFEENQQIKDVTQWDDINELIIISDLAVLDYSSIRFDYAQTRKPMIFFVPDLDRYKNSRTFLLPYGKTAPGPKVYTESQLIKAILSADSWHKKYQKPYREFLNQFTPNEDGHATQRVNKIVFGV
ncbi:MAG: CDP-glycerol glycerophosphotransferase family protein [Bifidobacteriaceae bacterium]|nr:CDP-glycerol glycerophosphotransferase family protein [Bifidobacteriaceae bacterium]